MSTIWTPGGERPVPPPTPPQPERPVAGPAGAPAGRPGPDDEPTAEELEALRDQLARTPAAVVLANHCMGLFELAALHMSLTPPQLTDAQLAIDALGAVVEGLPGRLGEAETQLKEALTQLRFAFVQISGAPTGGDTSQPGAG